MNVIHKNTQFVEDQYNQWRSRSPCDMWSRGPSCRTSRAAAFCTPAVGGHRSGEMKFIDVFFVHFNAYFACSFFPEVVQKQTLGEVGT